MPDNNRISAEITEANKTLILQKIAEIRALLPFLVSLTPDERQTLPKLGERTLAFDQKCQTYMTQNPTLVPSFVIVAEVDKDRSLRLPLRDILRELNALTDAGNDSDLLLGSEIYNADLAFYQNVRQAAKRGVANAQTVFDDLKNRFPGSSATPAQPPKP